VICGKKVEGKVLGPHIVGGRIKRSWHGVNETVNFVIGEAVVFTLFCLCESVHGLVVGVGE